MIDYRTESLISLTVAAKRCPGRPNVSTIWRWAGRDANPLETVRVGGRRYTSVEALERFIHRCTTGCVGQQSPLSEPTALRQRDHLRAEQELQAAGIA